MFLQIHKVTLKFYFRQSCRFKQSLSFSANERMTEYEDQFMRKVLQKTNGCVLYNPRKKLKYLLTPNEFYDNNAIISNLLSVAQKINIGTRSYDSNSIGKILSPLNDQCLHSHKAWSMQEQLFALDVWHSVRNYPKNTFSESMINEFLDKLYSLEKGPSLQTIYYVARTKHQLTPSQQDIVARKFEETIKLLSLEETCIYCLALIKSDSSINNKNLVKQIFARLLNEKLSNHEDIAVTGLLKAVRRFATVEHIPEIQNLQCKLVPYAEEASLITLTHMIQLGSKQRVFNAQLINIIMKRFVKNSDSLRIKDVERALLTLSTRNEKTQNGIERQFLDMVQRCLLMSLDTKFIPSLIRCISYMVIHGGVDMKLIDWALSLKTHSNAYGVRISSDEHALLIIDSYAKINLAGKYKGQTLSSDLCATLMPRVTDGAGQQTEMTNNIDNVLNGNGVHCIMCKPIPHIPYPDLFFVYNKRLNKTISQLQGNADGTILSAASLQKNNRDLISIAVIPCLQRHTVFKSKQYTGLFEYKLDQLNKLGFKTIVIRQTFWKQYKTPAAKRRYLALQFCKNDVFILNK